MFRRIVLTALAAGVLAGIFLWGVQMVTTTPLIIQAEVFESGGMEADGHSHDSAAEETDGHSHDEEAWMPDEGFERHAFTLLTSILMGAGFGFILTAVFALRGRDVGLNEGILWGLGGFAAFYMSPALGMPPELPGMMAPDFDARQIWWISAAISCAAGLALLVFAGNLLWRIAGILVIVAPHAYGAPHVPLDELYLNIPAELAAQFAVSSLVTVGLFWIVLGAFAGYFYDRFAEA